jgi:hypothetical protein
MSATGNLAASARRPATPRFDTAAARFVVRLGRLTVRFRYPVLLAWGLGWFAFAYSKTAHSINDWIIFEIGARTFVHYHHMAIYAGNPLHLYANDPAIQVGPPPLVAVAAAQGLAPHPVALLFGLLMSVAGCATVAAVEALAHRIRHPADHRRIAVTTLLGGLVLTAVWSYGAGFWRHLDDVMALTCVAVALWLVARRRPWWLIGLLLGTAAATKPWAIVAAPLLLGLPRKDRARTALVLLAAAAAWWLPFIIAAPETTKALGTYHLIPKPGSTLYAFGIHHNVARWLRPVQFDLGLVAAGWLALRGRWTAAPLAGIAVRVCFDPYAFGYYGIGPVLAALVWDLTGSRRTVPRWTIGTVLVLYAVPVVPSHFLAGVARLGWALTVLAALVGGAVRQSRRAARPADESVSTAARPVPA